jgi:tRNA A-37 threonylcarbamoyl transferase component Bud32
MDAFLRCTPNPLKKCHQNFVDTIPHMQGGVKIGETRICSDDVMAAGMSAVFHANTCCIASDSICRDVMHVPSNQWMYSAFKGDRGTTLKAGAGITAPGVPAIEIEALEKFRGTGLVPQLYATLSTQITIRGEIFQPATFVMEMLQGEEVKKYLVDRQRLWRDFLANGSAASAAAVEKKVNCVMQKVIRGLEIFENAGYTHGDAHLGNVFVTNNETGECPDVKFIDFGLGSKNVGKPTAVDLLEDIYKPLAYMDLIRGILQAKQDKKPAPPGGDNFADPDSVRAIQAQMARSRHLGGHLVDLAPNGATERLLEQYTKDLFTADDVALIFGRYGNNWRSAFDSAVSQSQVTSLPPASFFPARVTVTGTVTLLDYLLDPASDFWAEYLDHPTTAAAAGVVAKVQCMANNALNQIIEGNGFVRVHSNGVILYASGRQKNGCPEIISTGDTLSKGGSVHAQVMAQLLDTLNRVSYVVYRITTDGLTDSLQAFFTEHLTPSALANLKSLSGRIRSGCARIELVPDDAFETNVRSIISSYPVNRYYATTNWVPSVHDPTGWVYSLGKKVLLANHAGPLVRAATATSASDSSDSTNSQQHSKSHSFSSNPKVSDDFSSNLKYFGSGFRSSENSTIGKRVGGGMAGWLIAVIVISAVLVLASAGAAIYWFKFRQSH